MGALLIPLTAEYLVTAFGRVLVGIGWSCVNVAVTALLQTWRQPTSEAV
jgi:hypothetical protein